MFRKLPDDPELEEMDPIMKSWMFHSWLEDFGDEHQMLENQGYLIGSFINPEAVRKLLGQDSETHTSTETEFEENWKQVFETNRQEETPRRRRKRKLQG